MGDPAEAGLEIVEIAADGDILLDVTFETSKETLKAARKAAKPRPGQKDAPPVFRPKVRLGFRVRALTLRQCSKFFDTQLDYTKFFEGRSIASAHERLSLQQVNPSEAPAGDLPLVEILVDDQATKSAGQETIFGDLMRILHEKEPVTKPLTIKYLATLAVLSDRFDCIGPVARGLHGRLNIKWPATHARLSREDGDSSLTIAVEETLRQKILVSWRFDQTTTFSEATRELVMYGSRKWSLALEEEEVDEAIWWGLPDGLERELKYRRECVLNTIASIQRYFIRRYTSRKRQCTLGYDSSASCDSYQLGEMVKFLVSHDLMSLADFSPSSLSEMTQDYAAVDINHIISALRQCPSYQIDKNHTNCGWRTRLLPILDYIKGMMSSSSIAISGPAWKKNRDTTSWFPGDEKDAKKDEKIFRFTRSVLGDQRLRFEGAMGTNRLAKALFTADEWDWSPEE
ncbi:hypothetical protein OQA88_6254 [Cercophora sp. LCS_1]